MLWKVNFITILVLNSITEFWAEDRDLKDICGSDHSSIKNDTLP
jgi:hypothetical protein